MWVFRYLQCGHKYKNIAHKVPGFEVTSLNGDRFDVIECFTTTFLHTRSWLNWVNEDDDEDEVGLKEKPEDTIDTSKRLHRNKT